MRQDYLHRIRDTVTRLTTLVDDVLLMGRVGRGKLTCEPKPIDLVTFCQRLIEEVKFSWSEERVIQLELGDDSEGNAKHLQQLQMDETLLRHIFVNLLTNALKYSPVDQPVKLRIRAEDYSVHFFIQDRGIGIPEAEQASLFTPLWRATNVGGIQGTGLGLAIAHQCTELHGGTIRCTSNKRQGTQVEVILPIMSFQG